MPAQLARSKPTAAPGLQLSTVGLFAGIGGLELGLRHAGHHAALLCENNPAAQAVLRSQFPDAKLTGDIRELKSLPRVDLVVAGFPCQDLSQAGRTAGIQGSNSGLVGEVFRLLKSPKQAPRWLLLENVPFMLQLDRGRAMTYLTRRLEAAGMRWAYRTVDTRCTGLPQRRQRVLVLASQTEDPRNVLFADDAGESRTGDATQVACGFYWTEGNKGLGWAVDAVPTLKGGSTIGIPSPPAIWMRQLDGAVVTPEIRDAERLQGFPPDWTLPAVTSAGVRQGARWKLVGNAVSVPIAQWLGRALTNPRPYSGVDDERVEADAPWPTAAWGEAGKAFRADLSKWPIRQRYSHLASFLQYPPKLLSARATAGFLSRARASSLRFVDGFLDGVAAHLRRVEQASIR